MASIETDQQACGRPKSVSWRATARRRYILRVYLVTVVGLLSYLYVVTRGISTSLVLSSADSTHGKAQVAIQRLVTNPSSFKLVPTTPEKHVEHTVASYVFLHIPKCGGTSVRDRIVSVLQDKLDLQEITGNLLEQGLPRGSNNKPAEFWVNTMKGGKVPVDRLAHELLQENRYRIRLLAGHVAYGACNILRPPCHYMTVLRDPRARLISEVKWIQHVYENDPSIANLTVSEFIEGAVAAKGPTKRFCVLLDNHETRLISGDSYSGMFEINGHPKTPCLRLNQTIADRAIEHVTHDMFHAGQLEELDVFFNGLGDKLEGVDFGYTGTKLNAASKSEPRSKLTPAAESLVEQMIQWDTQVYEALRKSQHQSTM